MPHTLASLMSQAGEDFEILSMDVGWPTIQVSLYVSSFSTENSLPELPQYWANQGGCSPYLHALNKIASCLRLFESSNGIRADEGRKGERVQWKQFTHSHSLQVGVRYEMNQNISYGYSKESLQLCSGVSCHRLWTHQRGPEERSYCVETVLNLNGSTLPLIGACQLEVMSRSRA